jgi:hypothetical protein
MTAVRLYVINITSIRDNENKLLALAWATQNGLVRAYAGTKHPWHTPCEIPKKANMVNEHRFTTQLCIKPQEITASAEDIGILLEGLGRNILKKRLIPTREEDKNKNEKKPTVLLSVDR